MKKVALFGPGTVIYPKEEEIVRGFFEELGASPDVTTVDCTGLTLDAVLNRMKAPTLLGGPRAVILREFFKAMVDDPAPVCRFLDKGQCRGVPDLVIVEAEAPPAKTEWRPFESVFDEVMDLSLQGLSRGERLQRVRQMVQEILHEMDKAITRDALELFLNSIDVKDPSFVRTELDKLVAAAGTRARITVEDVTRVVVTSKQDEVYSLTDALGRGDVSEVFQVLNNLLTHGVHPLALLQILNTWLLRLYVLKLAFSLPPPDPASIDFNGFKARALPKLKEELGDPLPWPLSGIKPYAIFNLWKASLNFPQQRLARAIREITSVDLALKGGGLHDRSALEIFLLDLVSGG